MPGSATTSLRVVVTRPASEALQWVMRLQEAGFAAIALPLIDIGSVDDAATTSAVQRAWQQLDRYAAIMFVSGNAVTHFFKQKMAAEQYSQAGLATEKIAIKTPMVLPPGVRFLAPGPGTAAALLAAGVPADQIDAPAADAYQFDSEALWQRVGGLDWAGRRVLVVRGRGSAAAAGEGRDWLLRQWQAAGADVQTLAVYERRRPTLDEAALAQATSAATDRSVWLFSSSEAVANLVAHPGLLSANWRQARALATHPRIVDTARARGWGVVVESRPALADIVAALRSIESGDS
jgi:uroporphyrinogen-III synthase